MVAWNSHSHRMRRWGGFTGVNYLLGSITRPDYAVVAEPTGLGVIWVGSMGMVQLDVVIRGVPAHAS